MKYLLENNNNKYLEINDNYILKDLKEKLNDTKKLIDNNIDNWEKVKKQIHDYEYVYTSSYSNKNISNIIPVSRSYFKIIEIFYEFNLINLEIKNVLCLAEAPGGFIQGLYELLDNKLDNIYGLSLLSTDNSVPKWNRNLKKYDKLKYLYGIKKDGDLYDFKNIISIIKILGKNSMDIITGDGGIDYSSDYSKQEDNSLKLIYCEILLALNIQKKGGTFICKIFDFFRKETLILISLLNDSYEKVYIYKPKISRCSNSEKYLICKNFKGYNYEIIKILCHSFNNNNLLNVKISENFINQLIKINFEYCNKQIDYIQKGINIINYNKIFNKPDKEQINNAINWCKKYNIRLNNSCKYLKYT